MTPDQKVFAFIVSILIFVFVIELVRRRKVREEYAVLWLLTAVVMLLMVVRYDWLVSITNLIGAVLPTTTLFVFSIIFLLLISVQFSIKLSELSDKVKNLAQENALLGERIEQLSEREP
ncbi:MAG: DUF2304 domain-containing protein [Desulfuromonas sp.]|nr:MAG: DUF2304 domain-containing protein [Desulfuromonas sp.]